MFAAGTQQRVNVCPSCHAPPVISYGLNPAPQFTTQFAFSNGLTLRQNTLGFVMPAVLELEQRGHWGGWGRASEGFGMGFADMGIDGVNFATSFMPSVQALNQMGYITTLPHWEKSDTQLPGAAFFSFSSTVGSLFLGPEMLGGRSVATTTLKRIPESLMVKLEPEAANFGIVRDGFDLALGLCRHPETRVYGMLDKFALNLGARTYGDLAGSWWPGSYERLKIDIEHYMSKADNINFNLDEFNMEKYNQFLTNQKIENSVTNWELSKILNSKELLEKTRFYGAGGKRVSPPQQ
jgi:hypothetical protein